MVATKSNRQARCLAPCQCHSRGEYYSIVVGKRRLFFPETKALDRRNNRFDATRGTRGPTRFSYLSALFAAIQGVFSSRWYVASVFVILILFYGIPKFEKNTVVRKDPQVISK